MAQRSSRRDVALHISSGTMWWDTNTPVTPVDTVWTRATCDVTLKNNCYWFTASSGTGRWSINKHKQFYKKIVQECKEKFYISKQFVYIIIIFVRLNSVSYWTQTHRDYCDYCDSRCFKDQRHKNKTDQRHLWFQKPSRTEASTFEQVTRFFQWNVISMATDRW